MSPQPDISVVLPVWNGARYLDEALGSILSQEGITLELIIIDDCSTDATPEICQFWQNRNGDRIKYFRNEQNMRLPISLNRGFGQATGKFWTWTSDDNLYSPTALSTMHRVLTQKQADVVYTGVLDIDEQGNVIGKNPTVDPDSRALLRKNAVHACFLFRPEVYVRTGGYDISLFGGEDWDFWIRAYKEGFKFYYIDQALYRYRVHDHSITKMDRPECLRSWARVIKKNKLYGIYPNALAMWVKSFFV